ncbi:MAG: hypothetical protein KDB53_16865 [Planctomycetes bacterium]|nr:hypothetical protein [Planctomycetota bacterium]
MRKSCLAVLLIVFSASCSKTTQEYLDDLDSVQPDVGTREFSLQETGVIFDAGQLGHEAFAGLATTESMRIDQALRALSHACNYLGGARDNALLQSDAAVLIGHLVTRIPIPPITRELVKFDNIKQAEDQLTALLEARKPLFVQSALAKLDSADEVLIAEGLAELRAASSEDFGRDITAWRAWYETRRAELESEFVSNSREPLERLGGFEYPSASDARGVLFVFATWLQLYPDSGLYEVAVPAALTVARQAAVHALNEAMTFVQDTQVRADVAVAMEGIADPSFGLTLATKLRRERDPTTAAKMIRALRFYPGRKSIEAIFGSMANVDHPQVDLIGAETLEILTGVNFRDDDTAWAEWWESEGSKTWP